MATTDTQTDRDTNDSRNSKNDKESSAAAVSDPDEFLTDTQRKFEQKKRKSELAKAKDVVGSTYRDRVEQLNYDLSIMSEHNDIPRISAAGNG